MNIAGPVLVLVLFMVAVALLLALVAVTATVARMGRDRQEGRRLVQETEAALRQAADDRQGQA